MHLEENRHAEYRKTEAFLKPQQRSPRVFTLAGIVWLVPCVIFRCALARRVMTQRLAARRASDPRESALAW